MPGHPQGTPVLQARTRPRDPRSEMLHLSSGVHLSGDDEIVYRAVDLEQAGGDGLYAADLAEATGLPEARVQEVARGLVDQQVLQERAPDDQLGPRYVTGPAQ